MPKLKKNRSSGTFSDEGGTFSEQGSSFSKDKVYFYEKDKPLFSRRGTIDLLSRGKHKISDVENTIQRLRIVANEGQIIHSRSVPKKAAQYGTSTYISAKTIRILKKQGIGKLYSHQVKAIDAVLGGSSIVAATPTASGKTLIYTVPVMEALMNDSKSTALFIFPLKALAQDQLKSLRSYVGPLSKNEICYCYDGDTAEEDRSKIRKKGRVIITNPDMLHHGILPHHKLWSQFFSNLNFVVVDEAHAYKGIFGSHVGCIIRRLLRIARFYKAEPSFITCSATIGNPQDHVRELTSEAVEVIKGTGAPLGDKHIICWKPHNSPYQEVATIVIELMRAGLQTLCFVEARKSTEIVTSVIHEKLTELKLHDLVSKVDSYRAGYSSEERRKLENDLQTGALQALITTNALELGINVGALDATVHVGVPGAVSSLWQQIGRSGRRQLPSLAIVVALERPLDQYYLNYPDELFKKEVESVFVKPTNPHLLRLHLPCAAKELPLSGADEELFGGEVFETARDELAEDAILVYELNSNKVEQYRYRWTDSPASTVSIRGTDQEPFQLFDQRGNHIEEIEGKMAFRKIHEGAIYHHRRETYQVLKLNLECRRAEAKLTNSFYTTEAREMISVHILEVKVRSTVLESLVYFGKLKVQERVVSYRKKIMKTEKVDHEATLDLPPTEYDTVGMWWDIPIDVRNRLEKDDLLFDALISMKRVILALLPAFTMCDKSDVNGMAILYHEQTELPQIFIYDTYAGGIGLTQQAFPRTESLWKDALRLVTACKCSSGCPACIRGGAFDRTDKEENTVKHACIILLEGLVGEKSAKKESTLTNNRGPEAVICKASEIEKINGHRGPETVICKEGGILSNPLFSAQQGNTRKEALKMTSSSSVTDNKARQKHDAERGVSVFGQQQHEQQQQWLQQGINSNSNNKQFIKKEAWDPEAVLGSSCNKDTKACHSVNTGSTWTPPVKRRFSSSFEKDNAIMNEEGSEPECPPMNWSLSSTKSKPNLLHHVQIKNGSEPPRIPEPLISARGNTGGEVEPKNDLYVKDTVRKQVIIGEEEVSVVGRQQQEHQRLLLNTKLISNNRQVNEKWQWGKKEAVVPETFVSSCENRRASHPGNMSQPFRPPGKLRMTRSSEKNSGTDTEERNPFGGFARHIREERSLQ